MLDKLEQYRHYRKYLEPAYGEAAPDAVIDPAQAMDMERPTQARIKMNFETIAGLTDLWKNTYAFRRIMNISTVNLTVPSGEYQLPLRIYLPQGEGPFPVMVFYHGGGWAMNSLDVYDFLPRYLADYGGVLVVAPEYRLAPEHRFPKGLEDAYAALVWAAEHAAEYGGDTGRISVCGDSAGGNLSAAVCLMARDRKGPRIHRQILQYPCVAFHLGYRSQSELRYGEGGYFLALNSEREELDYYFDHREDALSPYASPLYVQDLSGLPPAVFVSAECDPLLDQALMYAARLEDAGVEVEYHLYEGMVHAFLNRPQQKTFEALDVSAAACR